MPFHKRRLSIDLQIYQKYLFGRLTITVIYSIFVAFFPGGWLVLLHCYKTCAINVTRVHLVSGLSLKYMSDIK